MEPSGLERYNKAKKRVGEIKGFYIHLAVFLVVNCAILLIIYIATLKGAGQFWKIDHFFTLIFWGIGLLFHAAHVFNHNLLFGKQWETRQIRKYIDRDREESKKYN